MFKLSDQFHITLPNLQEYDKGIYLCVVNVPGVLFYAYKMHVFGKPLSQQLSVKNGLSTAHFNWKTKF